MPDELSKEAGPGGATPGSATPPTPTAPPPVGEPAAPAPGGRPPRRPSWLRAALWSLVVLAAGVALGGAGYRLERAHVVQPPTMTRTADGLHLGVRAGHGLSGLGLSGTHLVWQDNAWVEYMDTAERKVLTLGPGPGMRATWDPAVSDRFIVWFEAERQASLAAQVIVYDTVTGRRVSGGDVGVVRSYPALSGTLAVWCSATRPGQPAILGARVGGDGRFIPIADGDGTPVVSGSLVVWARSWTGPFFARDIASGTQWPVTASLSAGKLTGLALAGRTLVWGQSGSESGSGVVAAVDVDGGGQRTLASGITGLAGPAYDGATVVWAEKADGGGARVMARRPDAADAFVVAAVDGDVTEVAVSGRHVAWIQRSAGAWSIVVKELPR